MDDFAKDTAWFDTLTRRFLGETWAPFVGIAALTGAIASAIGIHNSTVRLLYSLGREGILPRAIARVHPTRQTPWVAATLQAGFSVILGLIFGYLVFGDPATTYGYFGGLGTLAVLLVYIFINVSVFLYFYRKERENFSFVRHALIPLVATAAVCLPIRGLIYPVPDPPFNLWPYLLAAWVLIGLIILFVLSRRRPELVEAMGHAFSEAGADEPDTTQEDVRRGEDRGATREERPPCTRGRYPRRTSSAARSGGLSPSRRRATPRARTRWRSGPGLPWPKVTRRSGCRPAPRPGRTTPSPSRSRRTKAPPARRRRGWPAASRSSRTSP
jgi:hypothetical protein